MSGFLAYVAFNKATNGQTDIKHEMRKTNLKILDYSKVLMCRTKAITQHSDAFQFEVRGFRCDLAAR